MKNGWTYGSFVGVLFVITGGSLTTLRAVSMGDLFIIGGNICWALYGVLGRRYLKGSSPAATSAMTMLVGAVCFIPFTSIQSKVGTESAIAEAWVSVAFMTILGSVLGYLWRNRGIARIGANRTSIFFNLVPVSTMTITGLTGGGVSGIQVMGTALVLTGVFLATLRKSAGLPAVPAPEEVG